MRVLHIVDTLGLGGAQTLLKGVFEKQKENEQIYLFALRKTDIIINIDHPNVTVYPYRNKYTLKPLKQLKSLIKKENIDVLHCHLFRSQVFGWIIKKYFYSNLKLIFHEHGRIFQNQYIYNSFINNSASDVDAFFAVSLATKRHLNNKAGLSENMVIVLYNFVDLGLFSQDNITWNIGSERSKLNIRSNSFVIGFAGRLIEGKGWRLFVLAAILILKKYPRARFLIAGSGKDKEKLIQLVKKYNLKDKVILMGYVVDMVWFYSLLDCIVMPSYQDAMPLSLLETLFFGIPVIASNVEALNEIVQDGENGLLFQSRDVNDLADKIISIIENENLRQHIIRGGFETARNFSLDKYLIDLNSNYRGVMNSAKEQV